MSDFDEELFQLQLKLAIEASLETEEMNNRQLTRSPTKVNQISSTSPTVPKVRTGGSSSIGSIMNRIGLKPQTDGNKITSINSQGTAAGNSPSLFGFSNSNRGKESTNMKSVKESSVCTICQQPITVGRIITVKGHQYHGDCFRCTACLQIIDGQVTFNNPLNKDKPVTSEEGDEQMKVRYPYHPECAEKLFNPICVLCQKNIPNHTQYFKHPMFPNEIYCLTDYDQQPACFSCHRRRRKFAGDVDFTQLEDSRWVCSFCTSTIVMNSDDLQVLYQQILLFYQNDLHLLLPSEMLKVPIFAVPGDVLNEQLALQTCGGHGTLAIPTSNLVQRSNGTKALYHQMPTIRGLTTSTVGEIQHFNTTRTITTTTTTSKSKSNSSTSQTKPAKTVIGPIVKTLLRTEEVRDVTGVLILYGLPHDLAASILAHETMHVFFKLDRKFPKVIGNEQLEEGMCQLIAYKYLTKLSQDAAASCLTEASTQQWQTEQLQRDYFMYQIENDPSLVYGEGFRKAKACEAAIGLEELLLYIAQNQKFPEV
jgi:hypothetical protein